MHYSYLMNSARDAIINLKKKKPKSQMQGERRAFKRSLSVPPLGLSQLRLETVVPLLWISLFHGKE